MNITKLFTSIVACFLCFFAAAQQDGKLYLSLASRGAVYDITGLPSTLPTTAVFSQTTANLISNLGIGYKPAPITDTNLYFVHSNTTNNSAVYYSGTASGSTLPTGIGGIAVNNAPGSYFGYVYGFATGSKNLYRIHPSAPSQAVTGDADWTDGAIFGTDTFFDVDNNIYTFIQRSGNTYLYKINLTSRVASKALTLSEDIPSAIQGMAYLNGYVYLSTLNNTNDAGNVEIRRFKMTDGIVTLERTYSGLGYLNIDLGTVPYYKPCEKQEVIFTEDFGQTTVRQPSPYMVHGVGHFTFADYLAIPPSQYNTQLANVVGYIENGYYAVVAPKRIQDGHSIFNYGFSIWGTDANGDTFNDHTGNADGAAMIINAGEIYAPIYKRKSTVDVIPGNYYKVSYYAYERYDGASINVQMMSGSGNTVLGQKMMELTGNGDRTWKKYEVVFRVPPTCTTGDLKYYVSLVNGRKGSTNNDYAIDDIVFEDLGCSYYENDAVLLNCNPTAEPIAVTDYKYNQPSGPVTINVLENDKLHNGAPATPGNVIFRFFGIKDVMGQYDNPQNTDPYYTVPGEGTWRYNRATGFVTFTPLSTFTGNPTPVTYTILDKTLALNGSNQGDEFYPGSESNIAQIIITYQTACYNEVVNVSPGIPTKHGITLLNRAGSEDDNWPMVRTSGFTVVESNNKGFVPTRMTKLEIEGDGGSTPSKITHPQEGMMIYDTTDKCLKIYDGTKWSCFSTPSCP